MVFLVVGLIGVSGVYLLIDAAKDLNGRLPANNYRWLMR